MCLYHHQIYDTIIVVFSSNTHSPILHIYRAHSHSIATTIDLNISSAVYIATTINLNISSAVSIATTIDLNISSAISIATTIDLNIPSAVSYKIKSIYNFLKFTDKFWNLDLSSAKRSERKMRKYTYIPFKLVIIYIITL